MQTLNRRKAAGVAVTTAALSMCFTQSAQAAPAGGGGWDDLGTKGVYYQSEYRTKTVRSGGGDFKACITTSATTNETYNLYEEDAESSNAKLVTSVDKASCWVFRDLGAYVDGGNDRAEFYIGTEGDPEMVRVHYYD
ncbi:hypothetical protein ACWKT3_35640 [Streptomyces violaceus]